MNAKDRREHAVRSVWYRIENAGNDPTRTDDYTLDLVCQEVAPTFIHEASDNQWKLFLREFHSRQSNEKAHRAHRAARERRAQKELERC